MGERISEYLICNLKDMRYIALMIICMSLSLSLSAQTVVSYSYDSAGNRTGRSTTNTEQTSSVQSINITAITPDGTQESFLAASGLLTDFSGKSWVEAFRFKTKWAPLEGELFRHVSEQYFSGQYALMNHKETGPNQNDSKNHENHL